MQKTPNIWNCFETGWKSLAFLILKYSTHAILAFRNEKESNPDWWDIYKYVYTFAMIVLGWFISKSMSGDIVWGAYTYKDMTLLCKCGRTTQCVRCLNKTKDINFIPFKEKLFPPICSLCRKDARGLNIYKQRVLNGKLVITRQITARMFFELVVSS